MTRRARGIYPALIGMAVGALVTGVGLPLTIDAEETVTTGAAGVSTNDARDDTVTSATETTADTPGVEASTTAGSVPSSQGAAAPSSRGGSPTRQAAASEATGSVSEMGVRPGEITLGVLLFDLAGVGRAGFGAPGANAPEQRKFYEAFIADVNDAGGVGGRKLVPEFVVFDPLQREQQFRACVDVTEDAKPFVVLSTGGFQGDAVLCVTEQHQTPMLGGQGEADEYYARSGGRLFTPEMSATKMARLMARRSDAQGHLRGKTIGVITSETPDSKLSAEGGLLPELKALGHEVAHVSRLSSDLSIAQSQIPVEVAEMRRKGVDRILVTASGVLLAIWFNQAEGQAYRPLYIVGDVSSTSNDFTVQSAPASTQVIAYTVMRKGDTRINAPEQPEAADCRTRYEKRTGEAIDRAGAGYEQLTAICGTLSTFVRAATAAGATLTRSSWMAAVQRLGSFGFPDIGGSISFAPRKFDGADFVRTKKFESDCRCFIPTDEFSPAF